MFVLRESAFQLAEQVKAFWVAYPEAGTTYEDVLRPEYWAHVAAKIPLDSEITVHPEDRSFYARLLVIHVGRATVTVRPLEYHDFSADAGIDPFEEFADEFTIKYSGPVAKFRVTRKSDGMVLAEGAQVATREMAEEFIRQYRKALAA